MGDIKPVAALQKNELHYHLYLEHTPLGPNHNQTLIVDPKLPNNWGKIIINDWTLRDGLGSDAKIIARAQGVHIQAQMKSGSSFQNYFSIVFEDEFNGSSLQVMGPVVEQGEWAIVGGTGKFLLAQGVIYKKFLEQQTEGNIVEVDIHAFYSAVRPWTIGV